jgi:hypothetical protein
MPELRDDLAEIPAGLIELPCLLSACGSSGVTNWRPHRDPHLADRK